MTEPWAFSEEVAPTRITRCVAIWDQLLLKKWSILGINFSEIFSRRVWLVLYRTCFWLSRSGWVDGSDVRGGGSVRWSSGSEIHPNPAGFKSCGLWKIPTCLCGLARPIHPDRLCWLCGKLNDNNSASVNSYACAYLTRSWYFWRTSVVGFR